MSRDQELLAAYPTCAVAVAWVELFICEREPNDPESSWDMMMRADPPMTLNEVLECLQRAIEGETIGRAAEARQQMHEPAFRTYLAGKMGMM